ncbi:hypothetical protein ACT691_11485 [Vibrio metschnikovii]
MSTKFASNPSCDGKKFFIEVTGIQHGSEHDFEFYDLADMSQQVALDAKKVLILNLMTVRYTVGIGVMRATIGMCG